MAVTSVDLNPQLIERTRTLTGKRSNLAIIDLALPWLIASKQKRATIDGILEPTDLPGELGAPRRLPVRASSVTDDLVETPSGPVCLLRTREWWRRSEEVTKRRRTSS